MNCDFPMRLQVYLAKSGVGSRRFCETLITAGRVKVNNKRVTELGTKVTEDDAVYVDDIYCEIEKKQYYFALNKPRGYVCTNYDPNETVYARDLIDIEDKNLLFNVGRLDKDSQGLIFFTNDGEFANLLTHPSNEIEKEYIVKTKEEIDKRDLEKAFRGEVKPYHIKSFKMVNKCETKIVLTEGKNREIRNLFGLLGYTVKTLKRIRIGQVELADLPGGMYRKLTLKEIIGLMAMAKGARR